MSQRRATNFVNRRQPLNCAVRQAVEPLESRVLMSTSWFVSTTGVDTNPGTLAAPFRTIQHAAALAQPGDTVLIRGGVYHETVKPSHSGTAGAPITFESYNGESVEIDGADPITGWTAGSKNVYSAPQSWDLGEGNNQVFVDGQMMNEARWPNTTLDLSHQTFAKASAATTNGAATTLRDASLTQPAGYWDGAIIHFTPGQGWVAYTATVTDSGPGYVTFNYQASSQWEAAAAGTPYYLTGKFQALDAPSEWYRDPATGKLYLATSTGDSPANHVVEAKHRQFAFDLAGDSYIAVRGLNIFAATINTDARSNNVVLDHLNAEYLSQFVIQASGWSEPSNSGIALNGNNDVLSSSQIGWSAGDGVFVTGNNNRVTNNVIHDVAYAGGDSCGIRLYGSNAMLDHNTIYNAGRDGIGQFGWAGRTLYNTIHDVMLQTTDGGGIYTVRGNGTNSEIAFNRVYNINPAGFGGAAIFLDDNSSNWTVDHNITWNVSYGLKMNFSSTGEHVYNNTLDAGQYSVAKRWDTSNWSGTVIENNIMTKPIMPGETGATIQNNLMPNVSPRFMNPAAGDYSLQSTSPAINQGMLIPPYTNGYAGTAPDLGAIEYGLTAFVSGASLSGMPTMPPIQPPVINPQIGPLATSNFQAQDFDAEKGLGIEFQGLAYCDNGDWAAYKHVNFLNGVSKVQMNIAVAAPYDNQTIELHIDAPNGALIGVIHPHATGAWNNYQTQTAAVTNVTGIHDLYIVFVGKTGIGNVESFQFA